MLQFNYLATSLLSLLLIPQLVAAERKFSTPLRMVIVPSASDWCHLHLTHLPRGTCEIAWWLLSCEIWWGIQVSIRRSRDLEKADDSLRTLKHNPWPSARRNTPGVRAWSPIILLCQSVHDVRHSALSQALHIIFLSLANVPVQGPRITHSYTYAHSEKVIAIELCRLLC